MYIGSTRNCTMRFIFLLLLTAFACNAFTQGISYKTSNAHSHNDYEQPRPFYTAYENGFGSIEADIHLVNGRILVSHDSKNVDEKRTIENLYLIPINNIKRLKKPIQLLIDIKTDARPTLDTFISILKKYPKIIDNKNLRFVISGNRPSEKEYINYPKYILFDGRLEKEYTPEELNKIALLSDDYGRFTMWKKTWPILDQDRKKINDAIEKGHALKKPVRLWGSPDFPAAWDEMIKLKVDYINTDKIEALSNHLKNRNELF